MGAAVPPLLARYYYLALLLTAFGSFLLPLLFANTRSLTQPPTPEPHLRQARPAPGHVLCVRVWPYGIQPTIRRLLAAYYYFRCF